MAHPESWMAPAFDVPCRPAESKDHEIAQALFGAVQIMIAVHGSQNVILGNPSVKRADQTHETILTNYRVNLMVFHRNDVTSDGWSRLLLSAPGQPTLHLQSRRRPLLRRRQRRFPRTRAPLFGRHGFQRALAADLAALAADFAHGLATEARVLVAMRASQPGLGSAATWDGTQYV
jgi:hypothetical protein